MRELIQQTVRVAVLSVLAVSNSHADFFGTLSQTINKVQQTVDGAKQAVESTTQTVNGAQQSIDSTKNTVQQVKQIPQQATQIPAQVNQVSSQPVQQPYSQPQSQSLPPQNGAAIDKQALFAKEKAVRARIERARATQESGYQQAQFQQQLLSVIDQGRLEPMQIAQRYKPQIEKDPNNQALRSQYEAEIYAAGSRNYDRMDQFCSDVETGKIRFEPAK